MEGDTVTLQDIFEFKFEKNQADTDGHLTYTGLRPTCAKFVRHGVSLPGYMDQHSFGDERGGPVAASAPVIPERAPAAVAFGARPSRADRPRFGR